VKKPRKVAMIGLAGGPAPWDDESFEIWTLNQAARLYKDKRIDLYFDIHDWGTANYEPDYLADAAVLDCAKVTPATYPYEEVKARYGLFLENSFPMMLYYAGIHGYEDLYLFGLNDSEFAGERAGLALYHAMGALRAEGRRVYLCNQYAMDYSGMYGYDNLQKTKLPEGFAFKERGRSWLPAVWPRE
jgi:hypothetical protein